MHSRRKYEPSVYLLRRAKALRIHSYCKEEILASFRNIVCLYLGGSNITLLSR